MAMTNAPESSSDTAVFSPALLATQVSVKFGGIVALDDVAIELARGELLGLIGPNGAGKTTLLNVLSGLIRPQSGHIALDGDDIDELSAVARARVGLGRTFQVPLLVPDLTVADHLKVAATIPTWMPRRILRDSIWPRLGRLGAGSRRLDADSTSIVEVLGLTEMLPRRAIDVPLGLARLLEVAQALIMRSKVILLDEPAAGLSRVETERLEKALHDVRAAFGVSLVLVEHDLDLVLRSCDRVHVLDAGRTLAVGDPESIRTDGAVRAAYSGVTT